MRVGKGRYEVCGLGFGYEDSVWVECSVEELWSVSRIKKLFRTVKYLLPNHPDKKNTLFVFIYRREAILNNWTVLFICRHFEHDSKEGLGALHAVMAKIESLFDGEAYISYLSGVTEDLVIEIVCYDGRKIPKKIRDIMRRRNPI